MSELVEFLTARLDEDEQVARAANCEGPWSTPGDDGPAEGVLYAHDAPGSEKGWSIAEFRMYPRGVANAPRAPGYLDAHPTMRITHIENAVHAARHDPTRVLREIAVKRGLVNSHSHPHECIELSGRGDHSVVDGKPWEHWEPQHTSDHGPCFVLRSLAAVYADYPDYREEWKP